MNIVTKKIMDCSTGHISKDDMLLIQQELISHSYNEGTFLHIPTDFDLMETLVASIIDLKGSDVLIQLVRIAYFNGCVYIQFDADGEVYDELPTFEW